MASNPSVERTFYGDHGGTAAPLLADPSLDASLSPSSSDGRERGHGRGQQAHVHDAAMAVAGIRGSFLPVQMSPDLPMHEPGLHCSPTRFSAPSHGGGALSIRRSWAEIVEEEETDRPCYLFSASSSGKRPRHSISSEDNYKACFFASDLVQDDLLTMCKLSSSVCHDETSSLTISISKEKALNAMYDLQSHGVICYFMGRLLKGYQLHAWAKAALGEGAVTKFIFLGKGFYIAICAESKFKFMLVEKAGVWGNGHFAMVMPWAGAFDPMQALMHFCPVWITLKEVSHVLLPFISELAAALGKILYVPNLNSYVMSRNIRICVLWCMKQPIPGRLKVDLGLEDPMYVQVTFNSFPNACYKCHQIGHYAKFCTGPSIGGSFPSGSEMAERKEHPHQEEILQREDVSGATPIKIFLETKAETVQPCANQVTENAASSPALVNALSDPSNLGHVVKPKRKQKKKKRTRKLEEIMENQSLDPLKSEQGKKLDDQAELSLSERSKSADKETTAETTVEDEDGGCCVQSASQEMEREAIDEVKEEQLGRVSSELHKYYDEASHKFILPSSF